MRSLSNQQALTIEGIHTLADFLATDAALEELEEGNCDLDGYGVATLADALKTNKGLKVFSVNSNGNGNSLGGISSPSSDLDRMSVSNSLRARVLAFN